jgi:Protein of unknown function (DUF2510)
VLDHPLRPPFWQRHPWLTGAAVFLIFWVSCAFIHHWYVPFLALAFTAILARVARHKRARARRDAGLRARADYEHHLNLAGDPRGIYGRYPPVQPGWFPDPVYPRLLRYFDGSFWTTSTVPRSPIIPR